MFGKVDCEIARVRFRSHSAIGTINYSVSSDSSAVLAQFICAEWPLGIQKIASFRSSLFAAIAAETSKRVCFEFIWLLKG